MRLKYKSSDIWKSLESMDCKYWVILHGLVILLVLLSACSKSERWTADAYFYCYEDSLEDCYGIGRYEVDSPKTR